MAEHGKLDQVLVWVYYASDDVNAAGYYLCAFYSTDSPSEVALHQINFEHADHIAHHTHCDYITGHGSTARRSERLPPDNPFSDRTRLQCRPIVPQGSGNNVEVHDIAVTAVTCPLWFLATSAPCSFDDFCVNQTSLVAPPPDPRQLITAAFTTMAIGCRHAGANTWLKRAKQTKLGPDLHTETVTALRQYSDTRTPPVSPDTVRVRARPPRHGRSPRERRCPGGYTAAGSCNCAVRTARAECRIAATVPCTEQARLRPKGHGTSPTTRRAEA